MLSGKTRKQLGTGATDAIKFASAINKMTSSKYWAMVSAVGSEVNRIIVFRKDGGNFNEDVIEERFSSATEAGKVSFVNALTGQKHSASMKLALGGENWGTLIASEEKNRGGYSLALLGKDIGDGMDLYIAKSAGGTGADGVFTSSLVKAGIVKPFISVLSRDVFTEIQDASDGQWRGAEIRTQEAAQEALLSINEAIERKDVIRANLGTIQNRLEGTITSLSIQVENLQASESRISDVDVANEMTEFTKNNILAQAATSMLAQANSLGALALTLING
jgi:flagellin